MCYNSRSWVGEKMRISLGSFPLKNLTDLEQSAIVPKGKEVKVFNLKLPQGIVCFVYKVAVSDNTKWKWIIDGEEVDFHLEGNKIYHFDPPFLVRDFIEFYAKNDGNSDTIATVFCDGICHKEAIIGYPQRITPPPLVPQQDLSEVVNSLKEIKNTLEIKTAEGEVFDRKVEVTDAIKMLYDEKGKGLNWTACDITNAGPDPVYIAVNKWIRPESPLLPGLTTNIDFGKRGAIKKLYLVCDKGKRATVHIRVLK